MTDSTDLHAVGCLLHLLPEVVGLGAARLQVAGKSRRLGGLIIPADHTAALMSQDQRILTVIDPLVAGCGIAPPPPWHVQIKYCFNSVF